MYIITVPAVHVSWKRQAFLITINKILSIWLIYIYIEFENLIFFLILESFLIIIRRINLISKESPNIGLVPYWDDDTP